MNARPYSNLRCYKLDEHGSNLDTHRLAKELGLYYYSLGEMPHYKAETVFFRDCDDNVALIRIAPEIVAIGHEYHGVHNRLLNEIGGCLLDKSGNVVMQHPERTTGEKGLESRFERGYHAERRFKWGMQNSTTTCKRTTMQERRRIVLKIIV